MSSLIEQTTVCKYVNIHVAMNVFFPFYMMKLIRSILSSLELSSYYFFISFTVSYIVIKYGKKNLKKLLICKIKCYILIFIK